MDMTTAIDSVRENFDSQLDVLESLVRIPSISASPDHTDAVHASAQATAEYLTTAGLENVHLVEPEGTHPYVIGDWLHHEGAPTVLLYAHHDVQPPGHVDRWKTDPFEPARINGRMYGRGAADDKAGIVTHAATIGACLAGGGPPCNVKVLIEGEEEIGSPHLAPFLLDHQDALASDIMVLADAGNWKVGTPGITYLLRGLIGVDVELRALEGPVHSGLAGGIVPDPALGLARLLSSLIDEHGDIAVVGFTDDMRAASESERERMARLPDATDQMRRAFGVLDSVELTGNPESSVFERLWMRPALTVTGFDSHPIAGSSNQIVSDAAARISVRLAPGQDPEHALDALEAHLRTHVPWNLEIEIERGEAIPAWVCEPSGWAFDAARAALHAGFGTEPVYQGVGGSIPFVGPFAEAFGGIPALLIGPGDPTSRIHGENESVHLHDLRKLIESEVHLLEHLAAAEPG